jgi:hypothetical protein
MSTRYTRCTASLVSLIALLSWPAAGSAAAAASSRAEPLARDGWPVAGSNGAAVMSPAAPAGAADAPVSPAPAVKNPKLSSQLVALANSERSSRSSGHRLTAADLSGLPPDQRTLAELGLLRIDLDGMVQVYVSPGGDLEAVAALIGQVGGRVERSDRTANLVQAWLPVRVLEELAADPATKYIRLPDYAIPQVGMFSTEGDAILKTNLVRTTFGVDGTGVRVGVISDGVGGLEASKGTRDLPAAVNIDTCNKAGGDPRVSGAEGTAMMEIVHDLAPGAELWFGHISTSSDFNDAVSCLAANTDVVVDDLAFFNAGPYDGTSFVSASTSAQLANAGHPIRGYATSVGNYAADHYHAAFADSGFTLTAGGVVWKLHAFSGSGATTDSGRHFFCTDGAGANCGNSVRLAAGGRISLSLQWNDPFSGSANDYDLGLWDETTGTIVAMSLNPQTGTQPPIESLSYANPHAAGWFDVVIGKIAGAARNLDLFVRCPGCVRSSLRTTMNFNTAAGSVPNESDAGGGVLSVGAIAANDPGNVKIEFYSSLGPTADGRIKPNVTGIDHVTVSGAGGFGSPFDGTSAAAPHIAGIMALLLQLRPDLKAGGSVGPATARSVLSQALLGSAVHLGTTGANNTFGAGRADALAAAQALSAPGGPCIEDAATACLVGGRFEVRVNWQTASGAGPGQLMSFGAQRAESDQSAFYWFFSPSNFEMGLKILDACVVNQRFWVFISGLTDQGWTVHIRDSQTEATKTYSNAVGHLTSTTADTASGLSCP